MKAILYVPQGFCPSCSTTKSQLLMEREIIVSTEEDILNFKEQGFSSFPVVHIKDATDSIIDTWCGLRIDKIRQYKDLVKKAEENSNTEMRQSSLG